MPAWWGKRSHKNNKSDDHRVASPSPSSKSSSSFPTTPVSARRSSSEIKLVDGAVSSRFPGGPGCSSRLSGFESHGYGGGVGRDCHPPPVSSSLVNGGSVSVSSFSSSGSSPRDTQPPLLDQLAQLGVSRGPGTRQCHPLPLPPTSPSVVCNSIISQSTWKKGRLLGRGTSGHVYLGFNSEKGKLCAIKEVKLIFHDRSARESLKQLNQEINLLSQLSHPNIVRYHGSELGEEALSVYLEYVCGGSIHQLLEEFGPFKEPVIQNYTRQILSGLAYLHATNTAHRDIKGVNILVDPNGDIKLADFGMATHITNCTSVLSFKGSPYWMAPELVMNANGYSLAVDIWSLGCAILEMATAKPPWSQFDGAAAMFKIGNSKDIPEIPNHLSSNAKSFMRLCLQRDPSLRPSAAELLEHPFLADQ